MCDSRRRVFFVAFRSAKEREKRANAERLRAAFAERKTTSRILEVLNMLGELFDPKTEYFVHEHFRPHWSQAGAVVFITFRTHDSFHERCYNSGNARNKSGCDFTGTMPRSIGPSSCRRWPRRTEPTFRSGSIAVVKISSTRVTVVACSGGRNLRRIVADALLHFDGGRYRMGDFIVMPTHVHLLAAFAAAEAMKDQCDSWLHYTALQINRAIGEKGKFWQQEPFDHLVRSLEQYEHLRHTSPTTRARPAWSPANTYIAVTRSHLSPFAEVAFRSAKAARATRQFCHTFAAAFSGAKGDFGTFLRICYLFATSCMAVA